MDGRVVRGLNSISQIVILSTIHSLVAAFLYCKHMPSENRRFPWSVSFPPPPHILPFPVSNQEDRPTDCLPFPKAQREETKHCGRRMLCMWGRTAEWLNWLADWLVFVVEWWCMVSGPSTLATRDPHSRDFVDGKSYRVEREERIK